MSCRVKSKVALLRCSCGHKAYRSSRVSVSFVSCRVVPNVFAKPCVSCRVVYTNKYFVSCRVVQKFHRVIVSCRVTGMPDNNNKQQQRENDKTKKKKTKKKKKKRTH